MLDKALTRLEQAQEREAAAADVIQRQDELIKSLDERDAIRLKNIDALERALKAEELAKSKEVERADRAEKRNAELESKLKSANKRTKFAIIGGAILGIASRLIF